MKHANMKIESRTTIDRTLSFALANQTGTIATPAISNGPNMVMMINERFRTRVKYSR
jgi:hypothetical protein